ncbi:hypothetical protein B6U99_06125 [Candidatus Geothermarchaeota archaeon ex4572_27]|nr:MAG: hypothetical protein B6U99_06125 [Candidatus Geothermarchaeota archaeon ex4572_27]
MDPVEEAISEALRLGAEQAEAMLIESRALTLTAERWELKRASSTRSVGLAVRAYRSNRCSSTYTSSPSRAREAAREAVKQLKASPEDPHLKGLPHPPTSLPEVPGIWDGEAATLSFEDASSLLREALGACRLDGRLTSMNATLSVKSRAVRIANSLGLDLSFRDTLVRLDYEATARDGDSYSSGYQPKLSRGLRGLDHVGPALEAAREALEGLKARRVGTQDLPLILTGLALHEVVSSIASALSAELVLYGRSFLSGKVGLEVGVEELTMVDDATMPGGPRSRPFDAEGVVSRRVALIERGVARSMLHNYYTACRASMEPTGHAARDGGYSYAGRVSIAPTNIIVEPRGRGGVEELAAEAGRALILRTTFDRPNLASGDFSAVVVSGFMVEGGSIAHPVRGAAIHVNLADLMSRVVAIGGRVEEVLNVRSPPILVERVKVAGAAI